MHSIKITKSTRESAIDDVTNIRSQNPTRNVRTQLFIATVTSMSYICCGLSLGHSAVLIPELQSNGSTIPVTEETASLITSVYTIIGPLGALSTGVIMEIWGRRKSNLMASAGIVLGWIMFSAAQDVTMIMCARAIEGFSRTALFTSFAVHTDEITDPRFRGSIFCFNGIVLNGGIMAMSTLGALVSWRMGTIISAILSTLAMVLHLFCLESPVWLVRKNRTKQAERSLKWIWGPGYEVQAKEELADLTDRYCRRLDTLAKESYTKWLVKIFQSLCEANILKPFLIMHFFNSIQIICGHSILTYYTIDMISRTRRKGLHFVDDYLVNILISAVRIISQVILFFFMFRIGRRLAAIISGIGTSFSMIVLTIILYVRNENEYTVLSPESEEILVISLLVIYVGSYCFGFHLIPTLMLGETQSGRVRGFVYAYVFTFNDVILGVILKNYHSILESIDINGMMFMFAVSCSICTVFIYLFVPETQGKRLEEIEDYFKMSNVMWITRNKVKNSER